MSEEERALVRTSADVLEQEVVKQQPGSDCILFLQRYVLLLKDNHSYVDPVLPTGQDVNEDDPVAIDVFLSSERFKSTERMELDTAMVLPMLRTLPVDSMEGIWTDRAGVYTVAMIRRGAPHHDLAGIVLSSKSRCSVSGQIKLVLKPMGGDLYTCQLLSQAHVPIHSIVTVRSGRTVPFGWKKLDMRKDAANAANQYVFQRIDSATVMLRLGSFNGALLAQLDSFYRAHDAHVRASSDLIIDVRGNGGGSEACWIGLLSYFYTAPIELDRSELMVSQGNIERYRQRLALMRADSAKFGAQSIASMDGMISRMEAAPSGSFIPQFDQAPAPIMLDSVLPLPKRVWILQDHGCASATESLIYYAGRSTKVTTVGTRSGGFVGFGNVLPTTICGYPVGCTTTRYNDLARYEFVGIPPDLEIAPDQDALEKVLSAIAKVR